LGASKDSSPEQIKKCYRKASLRHHPDKPGGSDEAFKEVARAYQVLSDPEQRALYDRFGEAGLQQQQSQPSQSAPQFGGSWGGGRPFPQQAGGPFPAEFFSSAFFGGGGSAGRGAAGPSFTSFSFSGANSDGSSIDLDLDELMRRMTMMGGGRRGPAAAADHAHFSPRTPGGRQEAPLRRRRKTAAPSSYERPVPCTLEELYSGATKKLRVSFGANKSLSRVFPVEIKPGYKAGTKITFPSSAHDGFPKMVFVVQERPHPVFARRGDDLVYRYKLPPEHKDPSSTLSVSGEASLPRRWPPATTILLTIPLLDGATWTRELDASSSLLRKGRSLTVPDLGMPIRKRGGDGKAASERGNLIIEFF
jgi:DnaJ family protein B protein 4